MPQALKLRARDAEDLAVLSTVLQDALVPVEDMAFLPDERRFVLVANRFRWEPGETPPKRFERTLSGLCFEDVQRAERRGFSPQRGERILALLALRADGPALRLDFAQGCSIRLEVERIDCRLEDLGEPWPTRWRPCHPA
ncbi:MAG: DUF2948 family protein [Stellaceae bacterium]